MKTAQIILYVGLDVHKESIAVALAAADGSVRRYGEIPGHIQAVDKLVQKLQKAGQERRFCYEAGPFGFVLCHHLRQRGLVCEVVAPSLIPKRAGDRIKTDARDAEQKPTHEHSHRRRRRRPKRAGESCAVDRRGPGVHVRSGVRLG